jgi:Zn-dependent M28 family amino/carboxypeptidase
MPGRRHTGPLPPLTPDQQALAAELSATVHTLAAEIGERNVFNPGKLADAEVFLGSSLTRLGYQVRRQVYNVMGVPCANLDVEIAGTKRPDEIVVIGAHYDAVRGCPAANDNGSGVAATLALARRFAGSRPERTLRFVFFANEEPPFFWTDDMGSLVYAKACKARRENIVAMLTPETIGCYFDEPGTQRYPIPVQRWYGTTGDFIAFIGMHESARLIHRVVGTFRKTTPFPAMGAGLPSIVPMVGASDHWSFWRQGYPALMITDTAPFRYIHYHKKTDTAEKLDYPRMARVVSGLAHVVEGLACGGPSGA